MKIGSILGHHHVYRALVGANKSWKTFCKAKLWAGSARDGVDATSQALAGKLSMKGARQQSVGDGSHHFLGATFLKASKRRGLHHSSGEEEQDSAKLGQIGEKHVLVLQRFRTVRRLCC